jgi:hypothetical protein
MWWQMASLQAIECLHELSHKWLPTNHAYFFFSVVGIFICPWLPGKLQANSSLDSKAPQLWKVLWSPGGSVLSTVQCRTCFLNKFHGLLFTEEEAGHRTRIAEHMASPQSMRSYPWHTVLCSLSSSPGEESEEKSSLFPEQLLMQHLPPSSLFMSLCARWWRLKGRAGQGYSHCCILITVQCWGQSKYSVSVGWNETLLSDDQHNRMQTHTTVSSHLSFHTLSYGNTLSWVGT